MLKEPKLAVCDVAMCSSVIKVVAEEGEARTNDKRFSIIKVMVVHIMVEAPVTKLLNKIVLAVPLNLIGLLGLPLVPPS